MSVHLFSARSAYLIQPIGIQQIAHLADLNFRRPSLVSAAYPRCSTLSVRALLQPFREAVGKGLRGAVDTQCEEPSPCAPRPEDSLHYPSPAPTAWAQWVMREDV